ncbi:MAG: ABC transporter ATP-binding protein [Bacteroidota bacterium]
MIELDIRKQLTGAEGPLHLRLHLSIPDGEFVVLHGPSGAGKTSTLRMLAGLLAPDSGRISVNRKNWYYPAQRKSLPPQQRNIGFVFQDYALFPNMTVRENLYFALPAGWPQQEVEELLETCALTTLAGQLPTHLSGGQQQRVALARALVQQPDFLFLDEPLSAQDEALRPQLRNLLKRSHETIGCTTLLVTHHLGDIFALADRVLQLKNGIIAADGTPAEIFLREAQKNVLQIPATVLAVKRNSATVTTQDQRLQIDVPAGKILRPGQLVMLTFNGQEVNIH